MVWKSNRNLSPRRPWFAHSHYRLRLPERDFTILCRIDVDHRPDRNGRRRSCHVLDLHDRIPTHRDALSHYIEGPFAVENRSTCDQLLAGEASTKIRRLLLSTVLNFHLLGNIACQKKNHMKA